MSSDDDLAYRRSVRNMSVVLAVIVIVVFAAIFIPPYLNPYHEVFQQSVSLDSPAGFTMHLAVNATTISPGGSVLIDGWVNSTFASVGNLTVADQWAFQQNLLWGRACTSGWPIGVGVMEGHYTQDNYTLGTLLTIPQPLTSCPVSAPPQFILLYPSPHSSEALASVNGNPVRWLLQTELAFSDRTLGPASQPGSQGPGELPPGVYTVVLADEWGDVLTNNFIVS
jgi:hypothetical protein